MLPKRILCGACNVLKCYGLIGPNQIPMFKKFLRACELIDAKTNETTKLYDLVSQMGWKNNTAWGITIRYQLGLLDVEYRGKDMPVFTIKGLGDE